MAPLDINSRLIGGQHALLQDTAVLAFRNDLPADAIGPLMDIGKVTDAMTGSVVEVQAQLP